MTRSILLRFTPTHLGLYALEESDILDPGRGPLDAPELKTVRALCAAVNAGLLDEAVFRALETEGDEADAQHDDGPAPLALAALRAG